jgi:hypothetical protein
MKKDYCHGSLQERKDGNNLHENIIKFVDKKPHYSTDQLSSPK